MIEIRDGERIAMLPQLRRVAVAAGRRHRWAEASPDLEYHIRIHSAVEGLGERGGRPVSGSILFRR
jgi:hypothetical protein